jgi:hypothetical protein
MTDSRSTPKPSVPAQAARPEGKAEGAARPPGELGGHTVQPWEQDPVPTTTTPNSKDVPPPQAGAKEAVAQGTGQGMKTTAAPGNDPSSADPGEPAPEGYTQALAQQAAQASAVPDSEAGKAVAPSQARPPRPPVYKPQNGHEPAPRPPPNQVAQAKAKGPATEGDALVDAITKAIAENLAKAFHQSVAQAVRDFMPLSGRSIAQPKVDVAGQLRKAPPKAKEPPATVGDKAPEGKAAMPNPAAPQRPAEAQPASPTKPAPTDPSAQSNYGDQPKTSQYGGTIEAPDEQAKAKLAAAGNPNNPGIGKAAAESADRETREGNLV